MNGILLMFHVGPGAGYAIDSLLVTFIRMAESLVSERTKIHIAFPSRNGLERCEALRDIANIIEFDPATCAVDKLAFIREYIERCGIDIVFGFDQPVRQSSYRHMRKAGVRHIISYQGAPMSSLNTGLRLQLKKLDVLLAPGSPDHYIFESHSMARTAYSGRGISRERTSVVHLGVDENRFQPPEGPSSHAHDLFGIPSDRRIIYYSGHMEERKGVAVLIRAADYLFVHEHRRDFHFLLLGNKGGEERKFLDMLGDSGAVEHITFGGYRKDIDRILPGCFIGTIASTGWDSFTMSALEIAACGLPLLVSRLQGLAETIDEGRTGFSFPPGDHVALAGHIQDLLDNPGLHSRLGIAARQRVLEGFTRQKQIECLVAVVRSVMVTT